MRGSLRKQDAERRPARLSKITDYERTNGLVEYEKGIVDCRIDFVGVRNRCLGSGMYGYLFRCSCRFGGNEFRGVRHLRIPVRPTGEKKQADNSGLPQRGRKWKILTYLLYIN